jgi:hypothetical protein
VVPLHQPGRFCIRERPAFDGLKPLSVQGLWLAVMTIPAAARRWTTSNEDIWVGTASAAMATGIPWARTTSAAATAKCSLAKRRS